MWGLEKFSPKSRVSVAMRDATECCFSSGLDLSLVHSESHVFVCLFIVWRHVNRIFSRISHWLV